MTTYNTSGIGPYFPIPAQELAEAQALLAAAQTAFMSLVAEFTAENYCMGITGNPQEQAIADALENVYYYGTAGALWLAYQALGQVRFTPAMAPFLTSERIAWMQNRLISVISAL
jgi:hypothetical protein